MMRLVIKLKGGKELTVPVGNTERGLTEARRFGKEGAIIADSGGEKNSREATYYPPFAITEIRLENVKPEEPAKKDEDNTIL